MKTGLMKVKTLTMLDMEGYKEVHTIVFQFFKGDEDKTHRWFMTKNPILGGISPETLLIHGRGQKLLRVVQDLTEGNML